MDWVNKGQPKGKLYFNGREMADGLQFAEIITPHQKACKDAWEEYDSTVDFITNMPPYSYAKMIANEHGVTHEEMLGYGSKQRREDIR